MEISPAASDSDVGKTTTINNDGKACLKMRISTNHVDGTPRIVANNSSSGEDGDSGGSLPPTKNSKVPEKNKNGVVNSLKHSDGVKKDSTSNSSSSENHHHQRHSHPSKNHSSPSSSSSSSSGVKSSSTGSKPKENSTNTTAKDNRPKEKSVSSSSKEDASKLSSKNVAGDGNAGSSITKSKVPSSSSSSKSGTNQITKSASSSKSAVKDGSFVKPKEGTTSSSSSSSKPKEKSSKPQESISSSKSKDSSSSAKRVPSSSSSSKISGSASATKTSSSGDKSIGSTATLNNSLHNSVSKSKDSSSKDGSSKTSHSSSDKKSVNNNISTTGSGIVKNSSSSKAAAEESKKLDSTKSKEKSKDKERVDHKESTKVKSKDSSLRGSSEKLKDAKDINKEPKTFDETPSSKIKEEKKTSSSTPVKVKKEPMASDDDDDIPLKSEKGASSPQRSSLGTRKATKRPAMDSASEDDDEPLSAKKKRLKTEKRSSSSSASKKRKVKEEYSSDEEPVSKKSKKSDKKKAESESNSTSIPSTPTKRKKKEEETQEVWKWWEEEKKNDGVKWKTLEHKGPVFAPEYERLPESVKFYYNGAHVKLSEDAEEVATFYAKLLDHDYTTKEAFNHNFFKDWRKVMTPKERELISDLKKCDFRKINAYFVQKSEERKAMTKEEKAVLKKQNEDIQKEYGFCIVDGHKEKIGNFRIEPPGLFRGRGEHPKMGRLKKRTFPEDVSINCGKDSKVPTAPKGHKWKNIRHDNTVTWLACWQESIQGQIKYVMLNPSSKLKGEKDWQKYEVARRLKGCVDKIRETYQKDFRAKEMKIRQRAVALYFIDKLALRAGNEKEEGETADTVGCCSLRVEHITLDEEKDGKQYVVSFDFLGKDSIRYVNSVPVEKRVFKNLHIFMENKQPSDDLFDRLTTSVVNKHLNELMEGLTAKVFRTFNASKTLQEQLSLLTNADDPVAAKMLSYNRANRAVAILCNHQRAIPKTFDKSMENLQTKIEAKKAVVKEAEKEYKAAKKEKDKALMEKKKKAVDRLKDQLVKLELSATDKEENKQIALGTSKLNYLDPRITVAWCKKHEVPIEKVYNRTQRDKFRWAIEMAGPDFVF